jgi:hypothetical protein
MIDDILFYAAKIGLERLQALASVQSLTTTQSPSAPKKVKKWAILYEKCEMRSVADGTGVHIGDTSLPLVRYKQALFRTMRLLGLWEKCCEEPLHRQVLVVRRALYLVCRIKYCMGVLWFEGSVKIAMMRVENDVPCIRNLIKL